MATMIPETCPSRASAGEKKLFELLERFLPDDYLVWYEPILRRESDSSGETRLRQLQPDFTILGPSFGLLTIEVKGWYPKWIESADDNHVHIVRDGQESVHLHPLRQARRYTTTAVDLLKQNSLLTNAEGRHRGQLCFPWGFGCLFSNIQRSHLDSFDSVFRADETMCRDELLELEKESDPQKFLDRLLRFFAVRYPFEPLSPAKMQTAHGTIHQEVVVRKRASKPEESTREGAVTLEVLDTEQERIARSFGEGHRVFFGVAGSGKTVLLLARARWLRAREGSRTLVLCYNRELSSDLRERLAAGVSRSLCEVQTFHGWAWNTLQLRKPPDQSFEQWDKQLASAVHDRLKTWRADDARRYDAILIDEGNDFRPEWFRSCVGALRDPEQSDLVIAIDGAQSLYGRDRSFTWKSVGIRAQGRSRKLGTNYRNTKEVLALAWEVSQASIEVQDTEASVRVAPEVAVRSGTVPEFYGAASVAEEHDQISRIVELELKKGRAAKDICVLYPRQEGERVSRLHSRLQAIAPVRWIGDKSQQRSPPEKNWIRLSTIHSAKGLESPLVILTGLDQLPGRRFDLATETNLLYVGMTRAIEELKMTWAGESEFTQRIWGSRRAQAGDG
ncbi:MAG: 3'-5' exonuclease [Planctomycetota bacterium]